MNRWWYSWLVEKKFPVWAVQALGSKKKANLLQDHERALWTEEALAAMKVAGISLLDKYPKCSQDLNPIETVWRELRARLYQTEPHRMEKREQFITRLRNAVSWLNKNKADYFQHLCSCQKEWAEDVWDAMGASTKH